MKAALFCLVLTILFLNNFLLHLPDPMQQQFSEKFTRFGLSHGDESHVVMTLKHYADTLSSGDFANFLNVPIFYGFQNSLLYSEPFFLQGVLAAPIYFVSQNIIFSFHLLAALTIFASLLATYYFLYYLTKNFWASILGGVIFVFNPFIFGRFPEHITYYTLVWIPLIFLSWEKFLDTKKSKYIFWFFTFLALNTISVLTYSLILSIFLPIYIIVRIYQTHFPVGKFLNRGTWVGLGVFLITTGVLGWVYLQFYNQEPIGRTLYDTSYYSAWPTDFLIASANNLIYGGARQFLSNVASDFIFIAPEVTEHNLFFGISPLVLLVLSLWMVKKSQFKALWYLSLGLLMVSIILSLGPYIFVTYDIIFPGPYRLLYAVDPLLHFLRVASRFVIMGYFFLAIICAFVVVKLQDKWPQKKWIIYLILGLTLLEYWNQPWDFMQIPDQTQKIYTSLEQDKNIKVILEWPTGNLYGNSLAKNRFVETHYMLYQAMFHHKYLLNGYSSYIPPKYENEISYLSADFPTGVKLETLKKWGVDTVILHQDELKIPSQFADAKARFKALGVEETFSDLGLSIFNLRNWSNL